MIKHFYSTVLIALIVNSLSTNAQVIISEYSASNLNQFGDNFGKFEDWIELHNTSNADVNIGNWGLSDNASNPMKWQFPEGTMIEPNGYLIVWCSDRNVVGGGHYHTNFKLTQTKVSGESILLSKDDMTLVESVDMELTLLGHSRCKDGDDWVICTEPNIGQAPASNPTFDNYTQTPVIDVEAGFYEEEQTVTISTTENNVVVRYTTDGNAPTEDSPEYTDPIIVSETMVVKARAFSQSNSILPGKIAFKTYFINEEFTLPVFSIAADDLQDLANGNGDLRPIGSIEYFKNEQLIANSYGELNRHGQDSWVLPHRSLDWVSRDEMGYSAVVQAKLFSNSDRYQFQRFMLRASGDDNYPAINDGAHEGSTHVRDEYVHTLAEKGGMHLDIRSVERVVAFLNGEYWGVYGLRDRPVDHDYTKERYNQGKYEMQYLLTWGNSWAEYGGMQGFEDWFELRDFILENDMGDPDNYALVKEQMDVVSLMDYMITNLNAVSSDWLNYNTGWWRGLNPDGGHKKWGYILWDNDATFDYYINYSGVPNINPDAQPCDIDDISEAMDDFFGTDPGTGEPGDSTNTEECNTILSGSSPYPFDDPIFIQVVEQDPFCCESDWDGLCQDQYDNIQNNIDPEDCASIQNGSSPYPASDPIFVMVIQNNLECCTDWTGDCQTAYDEIVAFIEGAGDCPSIQNGSSPYTADDPFFIQVITDDSFCCDDWDQQCQDQYNALASTDFELSGNTGKHEKIFLKLQEESEEFRREYYARQADMINTAFSCESMLHTLDSLIAIIEPEMPRQIERWGGSMEEWTDNVATLRAFVEERCALLDDGMVECFDVEGPYNITLEVHPENAGTVTFNSLNLSELPWSGNYFGGMDNLVNAEPIDETFEFSHWETTAGNLLLSDADSVAENSLILLDADTLIAVFDSIPIIEEPDTFVTSINTLADISHTINIAPNPTKGLINLNYELQTNSEIVVDLFSIVGNHIASFPKAGGNRNTGKYSERIDLGDVPAGAYLLHVGIDNYKNIVKVVVID